MQLQRLFFAALVLVAGVTQAEEAESPRGAELLAPFKRELQQALREGLARGPVEAIAACREQAPEIAKTMSHDGIRLGRTSQRLRNPANGAPDWVVPILEGYLAQPSDRVPTTLSLPSGQSGYVEPILLQPLCTNCHGEALAPDVAARIEELYPEDRAVGFQVGDLRGVFWIEFPGE